MIMSCTKQIGDIKVSILNDGYNVFDYDLFPNNSKAEIDALLKNNDKTEIETRFNCCLIETGKENILIDTGVGNIFGDVAGKINNAFDEIGFDTKTISKVVFTHLHADHIGGSLDEEGGMVYPNAEILIDENEYNFWTDVNFNYPALYDWKQLADKVTAKYGANISTVSENGEISSGVSFHSLYGHTPGHSAVRVDSWGEQFLFVSDLFVVQDIQLQDPSIHLGFDLDKEKGAEVREKVFDMIATDQIYFSGGHILSPTIGLLEKHKNGYQIVS